MAVKKRAEEHENHERWLVSYADFITLLFAFFVVMYSSSSRDLDKIKQISVSLIKSFGSHSSGPMEKANGQPFTDREATRFAPINNMYSHGPGAGSEPEVSLEGMYSESDPHFQLKGRIDGIIRAQGALGAFQAKIEVKGLRIILTEARVFGKGGEIKADPQRVILEMVKEFKSLDRKISIEATVVPSEERSAEASMPIAGKWVGAISGLLKNEGKVPSSRLRSSISMQDSAGFSRPEDLEDGIAIDILVTRELLED